MSTIKIKDRAAIVGMGETEFGKGLAGSEFELACRAIAAALADAGIRADEVDGLSCSNMEATHEEDLADALGFDDVTFFSRIPAGGGGGCGTVGQAAMAIATGQANVVVVWRSRKRSGKASRVWGKTAQQVTDYEMWLRPYGMIRPVDDIAPQTRRYMHDFGATRTDLGRIAVTFRAYANQNPRAMMHAKELTLEQYLAARWISDPLCLFDCCLESDGAVAFVLVSAERARDCPTKPAYVHSFAQGITSGSSLMANYNLEDPYRLQSYAAAGRLWRDSDFAPRDIKVAQIYDAFTPEVLWSLEGFGFCGRGEAAEFVRNGEIGPGGRLPVNTAGGSLSEAYIHGFNLISEAVRQIRGTSSAQIDNVDSAFVCSSEGVPTSAIILR